MTEISKTRYKETHPLQTVNRARKILENLGISVREIRWFIEKDTYYSLRLEISGTGTGAHMDGIGANGKGTTPEYALASAYAELIERMENSALIPLGFSDRELLHGGFVTTPDEIRVTAEEILEDKGGHHFITPEMSPEAKADYLAKAAPLSPASAEGKFVAVPFYSVGTGTLKYFPTAFLRNCFTTTGMSAGNSTEEALVQALSEIFERYAMLRIETEKITPPTIAHEYVAAHMPRIKRMIDILEGHEQRVRVILKDCSLGMGIPACAAILIFPNTQRYFVNFGAHPVMEIALERCLTEFLQGVPVVERYRDERHEYAYFEKFDTNNMYNHAENLVNATGYYPNHLFSPAPDYPAPDGAPERFSSNRKMLDHLVLLVEKMGKSIFVRDNSFLDFPAVSVVIPGLSQTHIEDGDFVFPHLMGNDRDYHRAFEIIKAIRAGEPSDFDFLAGFLSGRAASFTVNELFNGLFSRDAVFHAYGKPAAYMEAMSLYRIEKFKDAFYAMDEYVDFLRESPDHPRDCDEIVFHRCARDYFGMKADGLDQAVMKEHLALFFDETVVKAVTERFADPASLFDDFPLFPCGDCDACGHRAGCTYAHTAGIHRTVKDAHKRGARNQLDLQSLFTPGVAGEKDCA